MSAKKVKKVLVNVFLLLFIISPSVTFASSTDGTIDSTYKYAWSENIGWINFGTGGGSVHVTDSGLTGYAWNDNYGWINLSPAASGVKNNGEGVLFGSAWGENIGWINFSGVTINSASEFSGIASGSVSGRISFNCANCKVKTDWKPRSVRSDLEGGGGLPSTAYSPSVLPSSIVINGNSEYTANGIVALELVAGADVAMMAISNYSDFSDIGQETYVSTKSWDLCFGRPASIKCPAENTIYTVYAKFYTRQYGQPSEIISDSVVYLKEEPQKTLVEKLPEILKPLLPEFLKPKPPKIQLPEVSIEELVPKETPSVFQAKWQLLPPKPIREFVLSPLPSEIRKLAEKFPKLGETLKELEITKITDIEKLKTVKLILPGLTERAGLPTVKIEPGEFALPQGIPVAQLPSVIKQELPTEIVFVRSGGELIDFNIALTINEKGEAQQKISTIAGKPLQLVVKPDKPVKSIKGYVVFKAKKSETYNLNPEVQKSQFSSLKFQDLTASMIFANPVLAHPREEPVQVEEELVLLEFEYTDPDGDGIYTAEIPAPIIEGEYEVITVMDFEDSESGQEKIGKKEIRLTVVVDPEGYVYEKNGDKETRVPEAIVSIYWLNPEIKQYELWLSEKYNQENPQTTDVRGTYSFLVPEGFYYLKVKAPGYLVYEGKPFQAEKARGVHVNIELKTERWWLKVGWKDILLILIGILLLYNFYGDKMRKLALKHKT